MRITGGELGGRRFQVPKGKGVRPTADRVREAVFSSLGDLKQGRVLDLYAGSGSLGLEAISRGAGEAFFIERAPESLKVLRANIEELELTDRTKVIRASVRQAVRRLGEAGERFNFVFLDPPYTSEEAEYALKDLVESGVLADGAAVVLESSRRREAPAVPGLTALEQRRYGDTMISRFIQVDLPKDDEPEGGGS